MIGSLKPYPAYKDAGVQWLDTIPKHWEMIPNRALIHRRKKLVGERHTDYKLLSLTKQGVTVRDVDSGKGKFSVDMGTCQEVRSGDLIFCLFDIPETPRTVGLSHHDGMITGAYTVFECDDPTLAAFLDLFYRAMDDRKLLSPLYSGLRHTIQPSRFLGIKTPLPPPDEQAATVKFLDYADRRIRHYILAKYRLIKLLEEQKRTIIQRVVTRGSNPNVPLKPAGVDWLGDVPADWAVKPVGSFCPYISYGFTNPMPAADDGPFMLTANDIGDGRILYETARHTTQIAYDSLLTSKSRPQKGDVLVTKDGTLGRVAVSDGRLACINQSVALLRVDQSQIKPEYLTAALRSPIYLERMVFDAGGTTIKHIYITRLAKMRMSIPPLPEQDDILREMEQETQGLDVALRCALKEIGLFREYRTRLMLNVVTGKLDVREALRELPEEVEEVLTIQPGELAEDQEDAIEESFEDPVEEAGA